VFRVTEFGPGFSSPMHRTLSTDYCLVLSGELELRLDGGDVIRLFAGDTLVQRGTNHAWRNPSKTARCRFVICMIESEPIKIGARSLGPTPSWKMIVSSLKTLLTRSSGRQSTPESSPPQVDRKPGFLRRVVTAHDQAGKAVVASDEALSISARPGHDGGEAVVWSTSNIPSANSDGEFMDRKVDVGAAFQGGSLFRVMELQPERSIPMLRTRSIDYCMVLSGELELLLDGGETVTLLPGESTVLRGTSHEWRNARRDASCRFVVFMIESQPITINGKTLEPALY